MSTETHLLTCMLTEDERSARGAELAQRVEERREIEDQKKAAGEGYKKRLEANASELFRLSSAVRTGEEKRPVDCYLRRNDVALTIETIREDTGELVESRRMTDAERQLPLVSDFTKAARRRKKTDGDGEGGGGPAAS